MPGTVSSWPTRVEQSSLVLGKRLGEGGEGEVFVLEDYPATAFKRYTTKGLAASRATTLQSLTEARTQLTVDGETIDKWSAWPHSLVYDHGDLVGFLMPKIPDEFTMRIADRQKLAELAYLGSQPKPIWGNDFILPDTTSRLELLGKLAAVLDVLHARGYVYGDLSFANVVWTVNPRPRIMVLDCDGITREGDPGRAVDTVDWQDPHTTASSPTIDSDRYKLSLAVLRVLVRQLHARPEVGGSYALPDDLHPATDRTVRQLLDRAAGPGGHRPTAGEWTFALRRREGYSVVLPPARESTPRQVREGVMHEPAPTRELRPIAPLQTPTGHEPADMRIMPLLLLLPTAPPGAMVEKLVASVLAQLQSHPVGSHVAVGWVAYGADASAPAMSPTDCVGPLPSPPLGFIPSSFGDAFQRLRRQIEADVEPLRLRGFRTLRPSVIVVQLGEISPDVPVDTAGLLDADNPRRPNISLIVGRGLAPAPIAVQLPSSDHSTVMDRLSEEVRRVCDRLEVAISADGADHRTQVTPPSRSETTANHQHASTGEGS